MKNYVFAERNVDLKNKVLTTQLSLEKIFTGIRFMAAGKIRALRPHEH